MTPNDYDPPPDSPDPNFNSDFDEHDPRIEQALRLGELRAKVDEVTGGEYIEHVSEEAPMDMQEQFWEHVLAYETAPEGTLLQQLEDTCAFTPPPPEQLATDEAIREALWQLIESLAKLRVYLDDTNHLSDRDLYELLYTKTLPELRTLSAPESGWNCHIDMSEYPTPEFPEFHDVYLAYYADDEYRADTQSDFPEYPLPPKRPLPFDRDRHLPEPYREQEF